jgi:hypothetical protein
LNVGAGATLNGVLNGSLSMLKGKLYCVENIFGTGADAIYAGMGSGW